jgi:hypothetical protein
MRVSKCRPPRPARASCCVCPCEAHLRPSQSSGRRWPICAITYLNPAARQVIGLGPDEPIVSRNFVEIVTPATQRLFADVSVPAIKVHGVWVGETSIRMANGQEAPVSHMVIAHHDESGRIARCSGLMRNISANVEARHELQRQTETLTGLLNRARLEQHLERDVFSDGGPFNGGALHRPGPLQAHRLAHQHSRPIQLAAVWLRSIAKSS